MNKIFLYHGIISSFVVCRVGFFGENVKNYDDSEFNKFNNFRGDNYIFFTKISFHKSASAFETGEGECVSYCFFSPTKKINNFYIRPVKITHNKKMICNGFGK